MDTTRKTHPHRAALLPQVHVIRGQWRQDDYIQDLAPRTMEVRVSRAGLVYDAELVDAVPRSDAHLPVTHAGHLRCADGVEFVPAAGELARIGAAHDRD